MSLLDQSTNTADAPEVGLKLKTVASDIARFMLGFAALWLFFLGVFTLIFIVGIRQYKIYKENRSKIILTFVSKSQMSIFID